MSFTVQASMTVLALAFAGQLVRLRIFMLALVLSALVCIAISVVAPRPGHLGLLQLSAPPTIPRSCPRPVNCTCRSSMGCGTAASARSPAWARTASSCFRAFTPHWRVIFMVALWPVPVLRWFGVVDERLDDRRDADRWRPLLHRRARRHRRLRVCSACADARAVAAAGRTCTVVIGDDGEQSINKLAGDLN